MNSNASAILSNLSSNKVSRYATTVLHAEQQINDMKNSSADITSKTVDSHFGHLGWVIFTLRGFDISAQAEQHTLVLLYHFQRTVNRDQKRISRAFFISVPLLPLW